MALTALHTVPFSSVALEPLLASFEPRVETGIGADSHSVDTGSYRIWLEQARLRAETAATRRLIEDVLEDIRAIGEIDRELTELVLGALCSVESALELETR